MFSKVWLHCFLRRVAIKYPQFFEELMGDLEISSKQKIIMIYRYRDGKKFKEIGDLKGVYLCQRQVERLHQEVVDKIKNI